MSTPADLSRPLFGLFAHTDRDGDVPHVDEAGRIWCNLPVEVDPCGTVVTRCRRQLWSLIEQTSGHALPCTADPAEESLDDVDFGMFDR